MTAARRRALTRLLNYAPETLFFLSGGALAAAVFLIFGRG